MVPAAAAGRGSADRGEEGGREEAQVTRRGFWRRGGQAGTAGKRKPARPPGAWGCRQRRRAPGGGGVTAGAPCALGSELAQLERGLFQLFLVDMLWPTPAKNCDFHKMCGPPTFCCWPMRLAGPVTRLPFFLLPRASNGTTQGNRDSRFMSEIPPPPCSPTGAHNRKEWLSRNGLSGVVSGQLWTASDKAFRTAATPRTTMTKLPIPPSYTGISGRLWPATKT